MNLLVAAQSGWGKSFKSQHVIEQNLPNYDHAVVLDFADEYRGLAKAGMAKWWIAGPKEVQWSADHLGELLDRNPKLILAKHDRVNNEEWRELSDSIIRAARTRGDVLVVIDEAHFVAPQRGGVPDQIKGLATTGRGEGASSIWISQRLAEVEETVLSQCQARLLGGFEGPADLRKVNRITEYPADVHNPQVEHVALPSSLRPADRAEPQSLQKHTDEAGDTIGSEWIYSDNSGTRERRDTRGLASEMESTHHGPQGKRLDI